MAKLLHSMTVQHHGNNDRLGGVAGDLPAPGGDHFRALAPRTPCAHVPAFGLLPQSERCTAGHLCAGGGNAG